MQKIVYRFSKLNLNGLKLSKHVIDSLSQLAKNSCLSTLMLGETGIGTVSEPYIILHLLMLPLLMWVFSPVACDHLYNSFGRMGHYN